MIVKLELVPEQLFTLGVTITVAISEFAPKLIALNEPISPFPEDDNPMEVLSFTQPNEVPVTPPVKLTVVVLELLHTIWSFNIDVEGVGLTVMVKLLELPTHPFASEEIVIVATSGFVPALVAINEAISPLPFEFSPIEL